MLYKGKSIIFYPIFKVFRVTVFKSFITTDCNNDMEPTTFAQTYFHYGFVSLLVETFSSIIFKVSVQYKSTDMLGQSTTFPFDSFMNYYLLGAVF